MKKFKMEKILDSIYNPSHITQWDALVMESYKLPNVKAKSYNLEYKSYKKHMLKQNYVWLVLIKMGP